MRRNNPTLLSQIIADQTSLGIEVEKMRLNSRDELSTKPFPDDLSDAVRPFTEREYFTAQLEFKLPPDADAQTNIDFGEALIQEVAAQLLPDEHLWPYSCPPPLPGALSDTTISPEPAESFCYRQRLSRRYDLRRIMNTGVHINLSFSSAACAILCERGGFTNADALYLHLAQQFMIHRWLFTYLFGATPVSFPGYLDRPLDAPVRSMRSSPFGFPTSITGDYRSITQYVNRIDAAIATGDLLQPSHYYESVRLKSRTGNSPHKLLTDGVSHIELRAFDLNPNTVCGVTADQLRLIQVLAVFFATIPPLQKATVPQQLQIARDFNTQIALEDPRQDSVCQEWGRALFAQLQEFARVNRFSAAHQASLAHFAEQFADCHHCLSYQTWQHHLNVFSYV